MNKNCNLRRLKVLRARTCTGFHLWCFVRTRVRSRSKYCETPANYHCESFINNFNTFKFILCLTNVQGGLTAVPEQTAWFKNIFLEAYLKRAFVPSMTRKLHAPFRTFWINHHADGWSRKTRKVARRFLVTDRSKSNFLLYSLKILKRSCILVYFLNGLLMFWVSQMRPRFESPLVLENW